MKKSTQSIVTISRPIAEQAPARALQFLRTIGTDSAICAALQKTGFQLDDLKEGWSLVLKASGTFNPDHVTASPVADAINQLEAWRSATFLRARGALHRLHPEQEAFVFDNLASGAGVAAVISVAIFLDRLHALENSPDRKSTRKADHAALATLERRGVTPEERKHMRHLVDLVESSAAVDGDNVIEPITIDARLQALAALHAWLQDWSDSARSVIKRRDQLLRLGIGKRQKRTPAPPPVTTQPRPAPTAVAELPSPTTQALPPAQLNGHSHA